MRPQSRTNVFFAILEVHNGRRVNSEEFARIDGRCFGIRRLIINHIIDAWRIGALHGCQKSRHNIVHVDPADHVIVFMNDLVLPAPHAGKYTASRTINGTKTEDVQRQTCLFVNRHMGLFNTGPQLRRRSAGIDDIVFVGKPLRRYAVDAGCAQVSIPVEFWREGRQQFAMLVHDHIALLARRNGMQQMGGAVQNTPWFFQGCLPVPDMGFNPRVPHLFDFVLSAGGPSHFPSCSLQMRRQTSCDIPVPKEKHAAHAVLSFFSLAIAAQAVRLKGLMMTMSYTALTRGSTALALLAGLWLMPAAAQLNEGAQSRGYTNSFEGSTAYDVCLARIDVDPEDGFDRAMSWYSQGGGPPALHCAAIALLSAGHYADAADRLDLIAQNPSNGLTADMRAAILDQAGNAWMLEGFPEQAIQSFNAALALNPESLGTKSEIYFDRARAWVMDQNWDEAIQDLGRVLELAPGAKDVLTLRATGYRALGSNELAWDDVTHVLLADPDYSPALIERGVLNVLRGDTDAARADWVKVLLLEDGGDLEDAARDYLHELDIGPGGAFAAE